MIKTSYMGDIDIEPWEFALIPIYLIIIFLIASSIKNRKIKQHPEYRYYLLGLYAKIFGGLAFGLIYIFYYGGGDTVSYYESGRALVNLFYKNPVDYLRMEFLPVNEDLYDEVLSSETGWVSSWLYGDPRSYMVIRLISPLMILAFRSYFLTTILVSWVTYEGLWRLYLMFVRYYPHLMSSLAIAVLFMPSTVFWGSGIMKDPFTLSATGLFVSLVDHVLVRRNVKFRSILGGLIAAWLLIALKPYIILVLFPGTMYWVFNQRIKRIKNALVKFVLIPVVFAGLGGLSLWVLNSLSGSLGKFSLDEALNTATVTSTYLRSEQVGGNNFNIGEFETTWLGAAGKFVPATMAGLYRPYMWDVANIVMLFSALENTFLLLMTIRLLWRTKLVRLGHAIFADPLVAFSLLFTVCFGFMIGITTSNFGSLVRFKIPMLPFFVSGLYIALKMYSLPPKSRTRLLMAQRAAQSGPQAGVGPVHDPT